MKSSEIRKKFLKYFEGKGHKVLPGSSLAPSDPTVLLTLAGMLQFKPIFLGQVKPMDKKVTTVQKCIRMIDVEQVGHTARHQTFFEMLGNFSFGDYFKRDAIQYAWELLTKEFKIPIDKLSVAVFEQDDEAFSIWEQEIKFPKERIFRLDEENNFWAAGPTGPCGPCSEIYYDQGTDKGCGKPNCRPGCDCDRFLEVWNLVFIQYDRNEKGELIPLKQKGIDTGMGLERLASVLQGADSNFETDLFVPLIQKITKMAKVSQPAQLSLRIIADHSRAITHLISDGVFPENTGRGYVLRRLIRRAARHGLLLGIKEPFLHVLAKEVIADMKEAYPALGKQEKLITRVIMAEEDNFLATLDQGMQLLRDVVEQHKQDKVIPGETAFQLHDTFGFPIELTKEIAAESGCKVEEAVFEREMEKQRGRGREAGISADKNRITSINLARYDATKFIGYDKASDVMKVKAVFPAEKVVILGQSPFYGESGGQAGDTGILSLKDKDIRVLDTLRSPQGVLLHVVDDPAALKEGTRVRATIDDSKRKDTEKHHTATHLLHKALREVLGDHVKQAGSYVGPDKLRFDFNHFSGLTPDQLLKVEETVNQKIREALKVEVLQKSYPAALKMGAVALFGEKYGDQVRVLRIGDYSLELCGGTHVKSTGDILFFKITSEGALGSGVRRIEAVAGQAAKVYVTFKLKSLCTEAARLLEKYRELESAKEQLGGKKFTETSIFEIECTEMNSIMKAVDNHDSASVNRFLEHLAGRVDWLRDRVAKTEREINQLKLISASSGVSDHVQAMETIKGAKVLIKEFAGLGMPELRAVSDAVQNQAKSGIIVLASALSEKLVYLVTVTDDLVSQGFSAKTIADSFAAVVGGKGGGKEGKAEGGGKEAGKIADGFAAVRRILGE